MLAFGPMAMATGSATISVDATTGAVTAGGSGMASTIAANLCALIATLCPITNATIDAATAKAAGIAARNALAPMFVSIADACAAGVVNEITTNAKATIASAVSSGRIPASTTQHTPIEGPAADVLLPIV